MLMLLLLIVLVWVVAMAFVVVVVVVVSAAVLVVTVFFLLVPNLAVGLALLQPSCSSCGCRRRSPRPLLSRGVVAVPSPSTTVDAFLLRRGGRLLR